MKRIFAVVVFSVFMTSCSGIHGFSLSSLLKVAEAAKPLIENVCEQIEIWHDNSKEMGRFEAVIGCEKMKVDASCDDNGSCFVKATAPVVAE
jgi:hypothetical protein